MTHFVPDDLLARTGIGAHALLERAEPRVGIWRMRSVDTNVTEGNFTFRVEP